MLHIGRNIFSLLFSRVISGIILFLIYTRLVQYLGPEQAGQFGLIASYLTVFNFFVDMGMAQLVIKKMSEDLSQAQKYLANFLFAQIMLGLGFAAIMCSFVFFADYPQVLKNALYISSLGLFLASLSLPLRAVIISFQKLAINAQVNFFNALINAAMMAGAIMYSRNIFFLATISVVIGLFDIIVYSLIVNRKFVRVKLEIDRSFIKRLFVLTAPFALLTLFSIYNRIDGLLLPHLRNFTENGYYSAAYKFWDTLAYIPGVIGISLYPFFAQTLKQNDIETTKKGLETYSRYMIAVALPMTVGAFALAKPLTVAFFGSDFLPAASALWLLVAAVSVLFIYTPANSIMVSQLTKKATKITGYNLLFNIAANLVLIPIFGFVAAAAITVASETIQMLGYSYSIKKNIVRYEFFRHFIKPALSSLVMGGFIFMISGMNLWIIIFLSIPVYLVCLTGLRFFHKEDVVLFRAAVSLRSQKTGEELA
jgi:O-antigen/teichoic acid export membrane protein